MADTDIAAFLTARYDEDEKWARDRDERSKAMYRTLKGGAAQFGADVPPPSGPTPQNNPANRALADIAAKRAILASAVHLCEISERVAENLPDGLPITVQTAILIDFYGSCRVTLKQLAAPYADHPDYDPKWALDA